MRICAFCGREAECQHHLIFGKGLKQLSTEDKLLIDLCNRHHNMGAISERIHDNSSAEALSKMLGQYMWMLNQVADTGQQEALIKAFRNRYGISYL